MRDTEAGSRQVLWLSSAGGLLCSFLSCAGSLSVVVPTVVCKWGDSGPLGVGGAQGYPGSAGAGWGLQAYDKGSWPQSAHPPLASFGRNRLNQVGETPFYQAQKDPRGAEPPEEGCGFEDWHRSLTRVVSWARAHQSRMGFNLGLPVQQSPAGSLDSGKGQRPQAVGTGNVEVEDAMLDTYDLVYEQAMKGTSHVRRQELAAIQDVFLCCGKKSPFSRLGSTEADLCQGEEAAREDCLQGIRSFLRTHQQVASSLTSIGLALTVSALLFSSFLWFAIRCGCSLDRKGKYTLTPRACGRQPQEPSLLRCSQGGPTHCLHSEAVAIGPRGCSGSLRWLQESDAAPLPLSCHLAAHRALQGRSRGGLSGCPERGLSD
ncbi:tetraspanin-32 isoform X3 [Homo sapiens]|uniref:tetraspanin-32 isoform X3 n=1 Tax=Homo sapiens TaxID=9606 RepID=UPI0007DC76E8|nr:tetraspanin-32 isoform X3 [Homo sapiens]|eukprot:XP_016872554.1 tetraspanin-32 isoform X3 [Homo sapiens]